MIRQRKKKNAKIEKRKSMTPQKEAEKRNPSNDTLGMYYIAGKSAAKAARTGSWRKKALVDKPNTKIGAGKVYRTGTASRKLNL